ncbi:MAG: thiamine-phosphate kinase [Nitrospinae bacterium RIFCSPLOWO2_12_FULL_47_7]|nr:MAG: thiamine-phosphate kinase [Nitrospinae bacterium RIFCSPLOWO2_12_FULL_47_7]
MQYHSKKIKIGIGDDCAVYTSTPGKYQIATTDALLETIHFDLLTTSPDQLGRKALAVNISDIAAMGGTPTLALITLGIPQKLKLRFLDQFYKGLNQVSKKYGVELAGGDTIASPKHLFINITVFGEVDKKRLFTRAGARPGDKILVTGTLGDSALGLRLLEQKKWQGSPQKINALIQKHLNPTPRILESQILAKSGAKITSMIDISDGLAQDLGHICSSSGVGANLLNETLPKSSALTQVCANNNLNINEFVLAGGEDYELLFTSKPKDVTKIIKQFQKIDTAVTVIGEITPTEGAIFLIRENGRSESLRKIKGYNHFRANK